MKRIIFKTQKSQDFMFAYILYIFTFMSQQKNTFNLQLTIFVYVCVLIILRNIG